MAEAIELPPSESNEKPLSNPSRIERPAERVTKAAQPPDPLPVGGERLPSLVAQPGTPGVRVVTGQAVPQLFSYPQGDSPSACLGF